MFSVKLECRQIEYIAIQDSANTCSRIQLNLSMVELM